MELAVPCCLSRREMTKKQRQLILNKGPEKFIFRYDTGCEDELLDALIGQAKSPVTDFDWFDAAVLSFKLTQALMFEADELMQHKADSRKDVVIEGLE